MSYSSPAEVAMILPLPVRAGSGENAVKFISLKEYPEFFRDLDQGFPQPVAAAGAARSREMVALGGLEVVQVGDFEASFVPTIADFPRLDERFRLPEGTWDKLPVYRHYGFAVFKLKPGKQAVHPMAFSFPRASFGTLFFPTVHIHDGAVHAEAEFHHLLYCQGSSEARRGLKEWTESSKLARDFVKVGKSGGIVNGAEHCYKRPMYGRLPNRDTVLL